jgi:hypothetical protein
MKLKLFVLSFFLLAGSLLADEIAKPLEFTFYSGVSLAADTLQNNTFPCPSGVCYGDTLHLKNTVNNSPLFGFGVGYYFTKNLELEGNFAIAPAIQFHSESNVTAPISHFDVNVVSYNYDGNLVYNFDWKGMRPFLTAGIGGITRDELSVHSDFTYNFGGGVKYDYKNMGLKLEVKDQIIPDFFRLNTKKNVFQIQPGIFFRF